MNELVSPMDRIALLQTFVRIVEAGSISSAAHQLGTTQPTVSRRLQALEHSLGLQLIKRTTHSLKLTEDGERCYERAKELMADWETFELDLKGTRAKPRGHLRIMAPHAFGQDQLVSPVADFLLAHPDITVDWILRDTIQDFIASGIDCAIQVGDVTEPGAVAIHLSEVARIVVASPSYLASLPRAPTSARELESLDWLALSTFYRNAVQLTHRQSKEVARLSIRPRLCTDSLYALRAAAVRGLGVCVASAWLLKEDLAAGRLVRVLPDWQAAPLPVHLVYPAAPFYPARLKSFVQFMQKAVPIAFAGLDGEQL